MTSKDKELLMRDLSCRIPYGVIVNVNEVFDSKLTSVNWYDEVSVEDSVSLHHISEVKPYLFSLSSMTDRQEKEIQEIVGNPDNAFIIRKTDGLELWLNSIDTDPTIWVDTIFEVQDYLNKNHFDYRNLINKNLAIDCTNLNIY